MESVSLGEQQWVVRPRKVDKCLSKRGERKLGVKSVRFTMEEAIRKGEVLVALLIRMLGP